MTKLYEVTLKVKCIVESTSDLSAVMKAMAKLNIYDFDYCGLRELKVGFTDEDDKKEVT